MDADLQQQQQIAFATAAIAIGAASGGTMAMFEAAQLGLCATTAVAIGQNAALVGAVAGMGAVPTLRTAGGTLCRPGGTVRNRGSACRNGANGQSRLLADHAEHGHDLLRCWHARPDLRATRRSPMTAAFVPRGPSTSLCVS